MWIEVIDKELDNSRLVNLAYVSCIFQDNDNTYLVMSDGCSIVAKKQNLPYEKLCEILTNYSK